VIAILAGADEADHLVGLAGQGSFHSGLTGGEALLDIGAGGAVGGAALQQAQLDAAHLGAGLLLDHGSQVGSQAAQLGMAEAVGGRGLGLGNEGAVGIVDALGDGDHAVLVLFIAGSDVSQELVHVEVHLGDIDEVGAFAGKVGELRSSGEPAGVATHALNNGDHAGVIDMAVAIHFHDGSGDILGSGGKAGAVVGTEEVVIDGLGHADDAAVISDLCHILGDLVAGIHG